MTVFGEEVGEGYVEEVGGGGRHVVVDVDWRAVEDIRVLESPLGGVEEAKTSLRPQE